VYIVRFRGKLQKAYSFCASNATVPLKMV